MNGPGTTGKTQNDSRSKTTTFALFNLIILVACMASSRDHVSKSSASQTVIDIKIYSFNG